MNLAASALLALSFLQVVPNAVATFEGVIKSDNGKTLEVQVESGDTMHMYLTHSTKFIKDGKPVKANAFHEGDKVTVEAERDVRMNLVAVKVESVKEAPKPK